MQDMIWWLRDIEARAGRLYAAAADAFPDDKPLSDFLRLLSEQEKAHFSFMDKAAALISGVAAEFNIVRVDDSAKAEIDRCFQTCESLISSNALTADAIMDYMVCAEYSEWNGLFVYVVKTLSRSFREFIPAAAAIEQHKRGIERFLGTSPDYAKYAESIRKLTRVWSEKILVVDDEEMISDVIAAALDNEGAVDVARNGEEALEKLRGNYYAAIVSDVDMPVMNGMDFYRLASKTYPNMAKRFIFFTGSQSEERLEFFRMNGLSWLSKPSRLSDVKAAVIGIISAQ